MNTPVSPKVTAATVAAFLASLILPNVGLITPDMLHFLGPWTGFVLAVATAGIVALAGYRTGDPLRFDPKQDATLPRTDPAPASPAPAPAAPVTPDTPGAGPVQ